MTLEMTEAVRARLDALKKRTDAASVTEVIRRALALYGLLIEETSGGGRLFVEPATGERRQVVLP